MKPGTSRTSHFTRPIMLTAAMAVISGCSAAPDRESSTDDATVTGTVGCRGKLLDGGEHQLQCRQSQSQGRDGRKASIGKDGTFTAKAYLGLNTVTVFPPKPRNKQQGKDFFGVNYEERTVVVTWGRTRPTRILAVEIDDRVNKRPTPWHAMRAVSLAEWCRND